MSKRLITDRDVLSGAVRPPLVLGPDTLITPSARDRAVRLGWTIVEDGAPSARPAAPAAALAAAPAASACLRCGGAGCEGGCPGCAGAGAGAGSSARIDGLADGLYLVRIEGGRMVSALPSSGPGLMLRSSGAARIAGDATGGGRP